MGTFEALGMCDGEVETTLYHNGRLALAGNLEIFSGTSRTIMKTMSRGLCRCGHSANMPYCDGTHARIGFTT
jgi:CDGSH-type Zn-finger protein